jgi:hypothetical protein
MGALCTHQRSLPSRPPGDLAIAVSLARASDLPRPSTAGSGISSSTLLPDPENVAKTPPLFTVCIYLLIVSLPGAILWVIRWPKDETGIWLHAVNSIVDKNGRSARSETLMARSLVVTAGGFEDPFVGDRRRRFTPVYRRLKNGRKPATLCHFQAGPTGESVSEARLTSRSRIGTCVMAGVLPSQRGTSWHVGPEMCHDSSRVMFTIRSLSRRQRSGRAPDMDMAARPACR